jgi:hypothetical protein
MFLHIPWDNVFFWLTAFSVLVSLALYGLNKKTFKLIYAQVFLEIIEISVAKEEPDGMGGFKERPFIKTKITNPSSFATYVTLILKSSRFAKGILRKAIAYRAGSYFDYTYQVIEPFGQIYFEFYLDDKFLKKYLNKKLCLAVIDIRKGAVYKKIKFAPYLSK